MRFLHRLILAFSLVLLCSCDGTISVRFMTGPQEFEVSTMSLALPDTLRDGATIASVPCGAMGMCPPSDEVTLVCASGVCDPAPKTIAAPGGLVDIDALLVETREVGLSPSNVESFSLDEVSYDIQLNTLTVPVGDIEVYWGPGAATAIDPSVGVRRLGTVPAIAARETRSGQVVLDEAGAAELSDYLVSGGRQVRFFAQTSVDLNPGDPFPEGSVRVAVNATITAVGRIL